MSDILRRACFCCFYGVCVRVFFRVRMFFFVFVFSFFFFFFLIYIFLLRCIELYSTALARESEIRNLSLLFIIFFSESGK